MIQDLLQTIFYNFHQNNFVQLLFFIEESFVSKEVLAKQKSEFFKTCSFFNQSLVSIFYSEFLIKLGKCLEQNINYFKDLRLTIIADKEYPMNWFKLDLKSDSLKFFNENDQQIFIEVVISLPICQQLYVGVILGQFTKLIKFFQSAMNRQKHRSIRLTPGVKRIQNYLFNFIDLLGKGNFSSVYKGINQLTNQTVAIKYIALSSLTCERLKELLDQEIEILTSLNHPNIVKCFQVLKSAHNCYIMTEICDGGDLQGLLKQKHFFTEDQMIPYVKDIFQGLYYLSKKNIVHRDVKVANIFLNKGKAKIADFGFAQRAKKEFNDGKIGTPLCMSPEGFLQNLYGCKTDVWAFGIILYQLTHGRLPFQHCVTEEMLVKNIQIQITIDQLKPQLSHELKEFIVKCLDVNPCSRITFQEMKNTQFMRKVLGKNMPTFSLTDLKCIPSYHLNQQNGGCSKEPFIVSLKNLDLPQFNHLNQNQKEKISKQNKHLNFPYGTNQVCQDLKPQNTIIKFQKGMNCICRPSRIEAIATIRYIPMRPLESQPQETNVGNNPFENNQQFKIIVSHKSHSNLPSENQDFLVSPRKQESIFSTTDMNQSEQANLSPLNVPTFKRHKGSFELTVGQSNEIQKIFQNGNGRPTSSRQNCPDPSNQTELGKRQKNKIDICPITNTKRLLSGFIKFNEAIGLIHYCRLVYKYISELKATGIYHQGDLNLRYYSNYLLNMMNELINKISTDRIILTKVSSESEANENKLMKMRKVIEEYVERYRPHLQKERAEYLNRTTGQIKQIAILDQNFIESFYISDKTKIQGYHSKVVKFTQILERCSRYQRYSEFDSNKQLEENSKELKQDKTRQVFHQKCHQNIPITQKILKIDNNNKKIENTTKIISYNKLPEQNSPVF